jgi:ribosomal protein L40E
VCQTADDGRFYLACDLCEEWFHGECVDITEEASTIIDAYVCAKCEARHGQSTTYLKEVRRRERRPSLACSAHRRASRSYAAPLTYRLRCVVRPACVHLLVLVAQHRQRARRPPAVVSSSESDEESSESDPEEPIRPLRLQCTKLRRGQVRYTLVHPPEDTDAESDAGAVPMEVDEESTGSHAGTEGDDSEASEAPTHIRLRKCSTMNMRLKRVARAHAGAVGAPDQYSRQWSRARGTMGGALKPRASATYS